MRRASERYLETKNYIHNELKLGREEIKDMLREVVKEEIQSFWHHNQIEDLIRSDLRDRIRRESDWLTKETIRSFIMEELETNWKFNLTRKENEQNDKGHN